MGKQHLEGRKSTGGGREGQPAPLHFFHFWGWPDRAMGSGFSKEGLASPYTVREDFALSETYFLMRTSRVRHIIVLDGNTVSGIITRYPPSSQPSICVFVWT